MLLKAPWIIAAVLVVVFGSIFVITSGVPPTRAADQLESALGKAFFDRIWVPAPSSTKANDGLGPLFNARACAQCHRAATAGVIDIDKTGALRERGAVVRLSDRDGNADPHYGAQLQTRAVQQLDAEARIRVTWKNTRFRFADGSETELRQPELHIKPLQGAPLHEGSKAALILAPSLRVASAIAKVDRAALDRNAGAPPPMTDSKGLPMVFGRKTNDQDLEAATALAFSRDLGMSTTRYPAPSGDCTPAQSACLAAPNGAEPAGVEITDEIIEALAAYVRALPQPTAPDGHNQQGQAGFAAAQCASCHTPSLKDNSGNPVAIYSDLRLHDMGDDLAGPAEPGGAGSRLWRTAPLLGLKERLASGSTLLHDGRARSIEEAILWHGGDAAAARDLYQAMPAAERAAILRFLGGK